MDMKQWFKTHHVCCPKSDRFRVREVIAAHYPDDNLEFLADRWDQYYITIILNNSSGRWTVSRPEYLKTAPVSVEEFISLFWVGAEADAQLPPIEDIL